MEKLRTIAKQMLELMGFRDVSVDVEPEGRKLRIFINESEWIKTWVPQLISDIEHLLRMAARRKEDGELAPHLSAQDQEKSAEFVFVDVNNYRKERERLIVEIAKAAARKAMITKGAISLPAMNAYERRLVHTELATRPDVKTESTGEGHGRYVVVKPI